MPPPLLFAFGASLAGLATLAALGAPVTMLALYGGAAVVGAVAALGIVRLSPRSVETIAILGALALLAVALLGIEVYGARRWVGLGPVTVQPAFLVLPFVIAARSGSPRLIALAIAMVALTLQPDSGTLGALALSLLAGLVGARRRTSALLLLASIPLLLYSAVGGYGPDPVAFVEDVIPLALESGAVTSIFALMALAFAAAALARAPALLLFFTGLLLAALLAPFPTPVVGASPSLVLGFWIAAGLTSRLTARKAS